MWSLKVFVLLLTFQAAIADVSTPAPVYCGNVPRVIYSCLGNPKIVQPEISSKCDQPGSECDKIKCIFVMSGWMSEAGVNRTAVSAYLDGFAHEHAAWSRAVQYAKATCLANVLPAQGVYTDCAPYDITHCVITSFFRNAEPSQWSSSPECASARQFAASCPVCPEDCFASAIPNGSCNACRILPPTPQ